ncbi:MAG: acetate--CoA ligase family protein [Pseudomonadota bacterium]|nr:acetate--CoA ligase family protein [Pseudomonadota bacterium]
MRDLTQMLHPKTVAIVGASDNPRKVRGMAVASLVGSGFKGRIFPVNPGYKTIQGLPAYTEISAIPESIDLAILVVAAEHVLRVLEQCAESGVGAALVLSGLPAGETGNRIQSGISSIAKTSGMTVLGPNALGFWNLGANVAATFAPLVEDAASAVLTTQRWVSVVSQSGGIGNSIYDKCHRAGVGVRYVITTGNEADLEMLEVMDYLIAEGGTRIILAYLEGFKRPQDFAAMAARAANRNVAIIVIKAGKSRAGERAAVSHTAHMTGAMTAYDAMFDRYGVTRVNDIEEMIAITQIVSGGRPMAEPNAMILSTGGGFGALLADACESGGIEIPDLNDGMKARLSGTIPDYGYPGNPIDLPGGNVLEDNGVSLARILDDFTDSTGLNAVMLCFGLDAAGRVERMRGALEPALRRLKKPALFHSPTLVAPDNLRALAELGVYQYTVTGCAQALAGLHKLTTFRERWALRKAAAPSTQRIIPPRGSHWTFDQTSAMFDSFGILLPPQAIACGVEEACNFARRIGYPVALKVHSADISHKSDVGGVELGVSDEDALKQAHARIFASISARAAGARIAGVLVQKMVDKGREFAIGVIRDRDFGLLLMLSVGGLLIEVLDDVVFAPLPLDSGDAKRMIKRLKGSALLGALRGEPASDVQALELLLEAISQMAAEVGDELDELEFNPVIVHKAGAGVSVVDFLVVQPAEATLSNRRQTAA